MKKTFTTDLDNLDVNKEYEEICNIDLKKEKRNIERNNNGQFTKLKLESENVKS